MHWWNLRRADRIEITHTVVGAKMIDLVGNVPDWQMDLRSKEIQSDIEKYWNTKGRDDADKDGYITNGKGQKIRVTTKFDTDIKVVKNVSDINKKDNVWVVITPERVNGTTTQTMDIDMVLSVMENNELLLQLAQRVKELREAKNVSQEDAFIDTGVHFGRIEQGNRDITFSTLSKICEYFQITMSEFLKKGFDGKSKD